MSPSLSHEGGLKPPAKEENGSRNRDGSSLIPIKQKHQLFNLAARLPFRLWINPLWSRRQGGQKRASRRLRTWEAKSKKDTE